MVGWQLFFRHHCQFFTIFLLSNSEIFLKIFHLHFFFSSGFSSFFFLFSHSLIYFAKFYSLTHLLTKFHNCLETFFFFFRLGTLNKQFLFYHIFFAFSVSIRLLLLQSTTLTNFNFIYCCCC